MGEVDAKLDRYLNGNARYADLINGYWFNGRQVVAPENVKEKDSRLSGKSRRIRKKRKKKEGHQKVRDMVRKVVFGTDIVIIAFENQTLIHYGMPIRAMVEDVLEYDKQFLSIQREHRQNKDLKEPTEYIGQFSANDKIYPTATIVLYFGADEWTGPRDLLDLMDLENLPEEIRSRINGYPLHILEVRKFKDIENFKTDLKEVFGFIQQSDDKQGLREYVENNSKTFGALAEDAYDVIASVTGNTMLQERKSEYQEGATMNLCKGMADWAAEERLDGRLEGAFDKAKTVAKNAFSMGFDVEKAATLCEENLQLVQEWFAEWTANS